MGLLAAPAPAPQHWFSQIHDVLAYRQYSLNPIEEINEWDFHRIANKRGKGIMDYYHMN
jgi:hypothetical protein